MVVVSSNPGLNREKIGGFSMKKIIKHVFKSYANVEALGKVISWNA